MNLNIGHYDMSFYHVIKVSANVGTWTEGSLLNQIWYLWWLEIKTTITNKVRAIELICVLDPVTRTSLFWMTIIGFQNEKFFSVLLMLDILRAAY